MYLTLHEGEISPAVSSSYRLIPDEQGEGCCLRINLKPSGHINFRFRSRMDAQAFVNRLRSAVFP